ncbi:very-long-chain 3-oxoacyl-CoA reductase-like [Clytia hemisphaerica]|uniref:very-long-chain 3-oxoacyl-CoA reductase-like n=1 Tax=Clytia hemisphaerica TaxID=252671 RepID=UPI0034D520F4
MEETYLVYLGWLCLMYITYHIVSYTWFIVRTYYLTRIPYFRKNLKEYGQWAVVTGCTDGIGKEYAKQLASQGLNVILISRNVEKLNQVASEIKESSNVETKIIQHDFCNIDDEKAYKIMASELSGLDIGILINNVGLAYGYDLQLFHGFDLTRMANIMKVNMFSVVRMTHMIQGGMVERGRGAMVHISSGAVFTRAGMANTYAATKSFVVKLAESLRLECQGIVDHQVLTTLQVSTKMSDSKPDFKTPTAYAYVSSALRTLGLTNVACGYPAHEFVRLILISLPEWLSDSIYRTVIKSNMKIKTR